METATFGWAVLIMCGVAIAASLTYAVRAGRLRPRVVQGLAIISGLGWVAMLLSDFPGTRNKWWADHSVTASNLSSLLLVGVVFLAYEYRETARQEELASKLSGAGLGGIVDHMVDVEVGLSFVTSTQTPKDVALSWDGAKAQGFPHFEKSVETWTNWAKPDKPLRWVRDSREQTLAGPDDPRLLPLSSNPPDVATMELLLDQCIRRILVAMREWTPLISASAAGTEVLISLSGIRTELMDVQNDIVMAGHDLEMQWPELSERILVIRSRCRALALCFENWSGAKNPRAELICDTTAPWKTPNLGEVNPGRDLQSRWDETLLRMEGKTA